jgi:hypothetical protein
MTTVVTLQDVLAAAETLSIEDQKELNRLLVDNIREVQRQESRKAAASFRTGDLVEFNHSKTGVKIYGSIKKFNPTRVIVESQYDKYGFAGHNIEWTVPASMLRKVAALPPRHAPVNRMAREVQTLTTKDIGTLTIGKDGKLEIK